MRNKIARSKKLTTTRSGLIMIKSGIGVSGTIQYRPATSRDISGNLKVSPKCLAKALDFVKGKGYYLPLLAVPVQENVDWFTELAVLDLLGRLEQPLSIDDFRQYYMRQFRNYTKSQVVAKTMYYRHLTARRKVMGTGALDKQESEVSVVRGRIVSARVLLYI